MKTSDFDYYLPPELVAQTPFEPRDHSRLLVLSRRSGLIEHRRFFEIVDYLHERDVLVFNDSRVLPARLKGRRVGTSGAVEILLLRRLEKNVWGALVKPAKKLCSGSKVEIANGNGHESGLMAEITGVGQDGVRVVTFSDETLLLHSGKVPLPPYIHLPLERPERYQTVYAKVAGSIAAPTAGLHFTPELLERIGSKGITCLFVTLHIGLDTFRPVLEDDPQRHTIYKEYGMISGEVANALSAARKEGLRIICVGTTTVRIVEQAAKVSDPLRLQPFEGWVDLFILPGHQFRLVDAIVTNFHLPRSSLLMLVTAFAGKEAVDRVYQEAIAQKYRFYSFGDAMLVI